MPRAGNASGGGQPGWILKCKGWETDPNAYIYFITQAPVWKAICQVIGKPEWITDPDYATPGRPAAAPQGDLRCDRGMDDDQDQVRGHGNSQRTRHSVRPDPLDEGNRRGRSTAPTGTLVEVDHPERGQYLSVGNPIKLSDSPTEVRSSPLLGEHNEDILRNVLKLDERMILEAFDFGALGHPSAIAAK